MSTEQEGAGLSNEESIANVREALDKATADKTALQEQLTEVSGELKGMKAKEAFRAGGFQDSHADLFIKTNPEAEISSESINEFVNKYSLSPAEVPQQTSEALTDMGNVAQTSAQSGVVGTAEAGKMTKGEYKKLQASDPTAAHEALIQGRVQMREDNYVANQTFNQ